MSNEFFAKKAADVSANQGDSIDNMSDTTITNKTLDKSANESADGTESPATNAIDSEAVERIRHLVEKATSSYFYMSNDKRVAKLEEALNIPVSDDKSFQQFFNHAEKDLLAEAYRNARKNSGTPVDVTNTLIMAEAQRRYVAKHGKLAIVNEEYMI